MSELSADRPYVFVSYASVNRARVIEIVDTLEAQGVATWFDRSNIPGGTSYGPEIVSGIKNATAILLMCSEASLASRNVRQEIQLSWRHERPILPILLEPLLFPDDVAYWLEGAQWIEVLDQPADAWLPAVRHALIRLGYTRIDQPAEGDAEVVGLEFELPPNNLPEDVTPLYGRERELRQIATLLEPGTAVTLTGAGGSGKTRLALQAARDNAIGFPDGIWFIDGSNTSTSSELTELIATQLGIQESQPEPLSETLAQALRAKKTLLIIDNLEQIPDAAALVNALLEHGGPALIATSRVPLKATHEMVVPVAPLEAPNVQPDTPASIIGRNPAVQLFIERAKQVKPDFQLSDGNAFEVAEICSRLDGLPLAIELAAARSRLLHPAALLNRLESRLSLLTRGSSRSARHQTLQASIAWSYDLLSAEQQSVFRKLAIFAGGAPVDTVERVVVSADKELSPDDVLDAIDELIDHSLLTIDRSQRASESTRVRMLETIREFAAEELIRAGEREATATAHAEAFLSQATTLAPELESGQQAVAMAALTADQANLAAAVRYFTDSAGEGFLDQALTMSGALWRFWWMRGSFAEGLRLIDAALATSKEVKSSERAKALNGAGILAFSLGNLDRSREYHEAARVLSNEIGDLGELARSLDNLGIVHIVSGNLDEGITAFSAALEMYQEAGDRRGEAVALDHLSGAHQMADHLELSHQYAERSLEIARSLHDQYFIAQVLQQLGMTAMYQGLHDQSAAYLEEALSIAEQQENPDLIASTLLNLSSTLELSGEPERAVPLLERAGRQYQDVGDVRNIAYVIYQRGHVARTLGQVDEARSLLENALAGLAEAGQQDAVALCQETLGGVAIDSGDYELGARYFGSAQRLRDEISVPVPQTRTAEVERDLAALREALGPERLDQLFSQTI